MPQDCKQYATNCLVCRRTKVYNTKKQGLLNPLPILSQKWMDLLLDFVVGLPECHRWSRVFCHILVVVDRPRKRPLYKLLETLHTEKFIEAMNCWVFLSHGYPLTIMNNCGGQMINTLWKKLYERRGIKIKFSSAQHPETDSQTKNANKVMKNYLWAYVSKWLHFLQTMAFILKQMLNLHRSTNRGLAKKLNC